MKVRKQIDLLRVSAGEEVQGIEALARGEAADRCEKPFPVDFAASGPNAPVAVVFTVLGGADSEPAHRPDRWQGKRKSTC